MSWERPLPLSIFVSCVFGVFLSLASPAIADARETGLRAVEYRSDASQAAIDEGEAVDLKLMERRWESFVKESRLGRYCLTAKGEEVGWLMSPVLTAYYYGFLATKDAAWVDRFVACTDAWLNRKVVEPDGYIGWPEIAAAGNPVDRLDSYYADSLLGEAMALRPIVSMSTEILRNPGLDARYGEKARSYIQLAESLYDKWDKRGAWRAVDGGTVAVVLPYGLVPSTQQWTANYEKRFDKNIGFSLQDNKQNLVALWMLAMFDATGQDRYREKSAAWFRIMKARMHDDPRGTFKIWNYWEPAGSWDYRPDGKPKHWIGVHPSAGYYELDLEAIVAAYEHHIVFDQADIAKLGRTAIAESRFWPALAPFDRTARKKLTDSLNPVSWEGLQLVPWFSAHGQAWEDARP